MEKLKLMCSDENPNSIGRGVCCCMIIIAVCIGLCSLYLGSVGLTIGYIKMNYDWNTGCRNDKPDCMFPVSTCREGHIDQCFAAGFTTFLIILCVGLILSILGYAIVAVGRHCWLAYQGASKLADDERTRLVNNV